ncbi:PEGA domain-containing protein [Candidatus Saccharibacteria bacterium]|nr:PEGA domain-containing protein [Candidatus Saccharibacteria bacterium]
MIKISQTTRMWIVSIATISFVVVGTILLVAFAQGYSYDARSKQIRTSGLVLINSSPDNASIFLNNKDSDKHTPYRYTNAQAGNLDIALTKPGYRNWVSRQNVTAGEVTFADYALLLPTTLYQQDTVQSQPYDQLLQTPDHNHTVAFNKTQLALYTISENGESKRFYQPTLEIDPQKQAIGISELQLAEDGQRVVFQQKLLNGQVLTIVVHIDSGKIDNLSAEFGSVFSDIRFSKNDSAELFWLELGVIKKIKINDRSISAGIVTLVSSYNVEPDRLLVVHSIVPPETSQQLISYDLNGGSKKPVTSLIPDEKGFRISFISSRYSEYMTVIHNTTGQLDLIKAPYNHPLISDLGKDCLLVNASRNGRFLVIDKSNKMQTIDLEYSVHYNFDTSLDGLQDWSWLDDHHLILRRNSQLYIADFDGQNVQPLTVTSNVVGMSVQPNNKTVLPLDSASKLYKLWLTKK